VRAGTKTEIACPPERVFDLVADMRNETQWNSRVTSAELRSAEPIGQGSQFSVVNSGTAYDVTITRYERPSRLAFEARGKPDLGIEYAFTPNGAGTDFEGELDFRPRGALRMVFALLAPVIRRDVRKQYAALKALCEGRTSSS
jgi:uncharacterized protein YndB with AHSA1/START domain